MTFSFPEDLYEYDYQKEIVTKNKLVLDESTGQLHLEMDPNTTKKLRMYIKKNGENPKKIVFKVKIPSKLRLLYGIPVEFEWE